MPVEVLPLDDGPAAFSRAADGQSGGTKLVLRTPAPASA
jgi:hypothetical protein